MKTWRQLMAERMTAGAVIRVIASAEAACVLRYRPVLGGSTGQLRASTAVTGDCAIRGASETLPGALVPLAFWERSHAIC